MKQTPTKKPAATVKLDLRERRCEQILEAAAKLFAEKGYSAADTQALADELQVGSPDADDGVHNRC